jgi:hypothetical protein
MKLLPSIRKHNKTAPNITFVLATTVMVKERLDITIVAVDAMKARSFPLTMMTETTVIQVRIRPHTVKSAHQVSRRTRG